MQRFIVGVIAGRAPHDVIVAVRALMDFRYCIQAYRITDRDIEVINSALCEFHSHKDSILDAGLHCGKANKPINNWHIPKLELMQSMVPSILRAGVPIQWSADLTKHAHIKQIKDPARASNNNNYDPQICRQLDHLEKCRNFDVAMFLKDPALWRDMATGTADEHEKSDPHVSLRPVTDYFVRSLQLASSPPDIIPLPRRAFSVNCVAFNLAYDPSIHRISIDEVAEQFGLPDLRAALADFLCYEKVCGVDSVHPIGGGPRRSLENAELPFKNVQVWFKLRLQVTDIHTNTILPVQTILACPPDGSWPYGRYDSVVVNTDSAKVWPASGLQGLVSSYISVDSIHMSSLIRTLRCTALSHHATLGPTPQAMALG